MLVRSSSALNRRCAADQRGVTLIIALIVLVGMTLAGIALMRSVNTSNIIAGNLAFQQSATQSADAGTESALAFLLSNSTTGLQNNALVPSSDPTVARGYYATRQALASNQSWEEWWNALSPAGAFSVTFSNGTTTDAAGNSVSFIIDRQCAGIGSSTSPSAGCAKSTASSVLNTSINSNDAGGGAYTMSGQVYYRITTRVQGPRNSVSYVQTIIAM